MVNLVYPYSALKAANVGAFNETPVGTNIVGPVVGEQLRRQGIWATVLAMAGILVYIALRFQFSFALGAVVAGDIVYDAVFPWTAETTVEDRKAWSATLDKIAAHNPKLVVQTEFLPG